MPSVSERPEAPTAIQTHLAASYVSLELSRSIWLITSLSPGSGEKMSKHSVRAGDVAALLARFSELKRKASERTGKSFPIVVIQEAGLDGFWLHRVLQSEGVESHVVDPSSIATSRRRRRAKTDRIDGEALLRALLAYKRGEPRVCAMVKAPTPEEEDPPQARRGAPPRSRCRHLCLDRQRLRAFDEVRLRQPWGHRGDLAPKRLLFRLVRANATCRARGPKPQPPRTRSTQQPHRHARLRYSTSRAAEGLLMENVRVPSRAASPHQSAHARAQPRPIASSFRRALTELTCRYRR